MWWIKDADRLKREVSAVDALREQQPWLSGVKPTVFKDFIFAIDFDIVVDGELLPFRTSNTRPFFLKPHHQSSPAMAGNCQVINMALEGNCVWNFVRTIGTLP